MENLRKRWSIEVEVDKQKFQGQICVVALSNYDLNCPIGFP